MPCPCQSSRLIHLTVLGERYILCSSSLWSFLHSPFSSLLGPDVRLRILFSNTLSLHSSLNVRDHVSQPYSTTGNIIVLYTLIYKFSEKSCECTELLKALPVSSYSLHVHSFQLVSGVHVLDPTPTQIRTRNLCWSATVRGLKPVLANITTHRPFLLHLDLNHTFSSPAHIQQGCTNCGIQVINSNSK